MNMGLSAKHASTVPLVLNLDSGCINSQFNVAFDDWFAAVAASLASPPDLNLPEWSKMFSNLTFQFNFDESNDDKEEQFLDTNPDLSESLKRRHDSVTKAMGKHQPAVPLPVAPKAEETVVPAQSTLPVVATDESPIRPPAASLVHPRESPSPTAGESSPSTAPRESSLSTPPRESALLTLQLVRKRR
jgi:hypothetical protein